MKMGGPVSFNSNFYNNKATDDHQQHPDYQFHNDDNDH